MTVESRFTRTWIVDGTPYTFRVPSTHMLRDIQAAVAEAMAGSADPYIRAYWDRVLTLRATCVTDPAPDFDAWPEPWVDALIREVTTWWASFRHAVQTDSGSVGGAGRDAMAVPVSPDLSAPSV